MLITMLLPDANVLAFERLETTESAITLILTSAASECKCPACGQGSTAIHSHYTRQVADLPWAGVPVQLQLQVHKFFCRNHACPRRIFAERLPAVVRPWARRTVRLATCQRDLGLAHGGHASERTGTRVGIAASDDTFLRLVRTTPTPERATPRVLGLDDWAQRKGQTYGTLLVDLETHEPVDLLPDRTAGTLAAWLEAHPGVKVVSRDRAGAYAEGVSRGAPEAVQVADRFHLVCNLRETLQRLLERYPDSLQAATATVSSVDAAPRLTQDMSQPSQLEPPIPTADPSITPEVPPVAEESNDGGSATRVTTEQRTKQEQRRAEPQARRQACFDKVLALHRQGLSQRDIAHQTHLGRGTIGRYLRMGQCLEPAQRRTRASLLDPFIPYLLERWAAGCRNGMQLWRELCERGYRGSRPLVSNWVARQRRLDPPADQPAASRRPGRPPAPLRPPARPRPLSARRGAWLLFSDRDTLDPKEQGFLDRLLASNDHLGEARRLAHEFRCLLRTRQVERLDAWLEAVTASPLIDFHAFAAELKRDRQAVETALSLEWNNGMLEGHVNRLKHIKGQMYGRAKFDLLKQRVPAA